MLEQILTYVIAAVIIGGEIAFINVCAKHNWFGMHDRLYK